MKTRNGYQLAMAVIAAIIAAGSSAIAAEVVWNGGGDTSAWSESGGDSPQETLIFQAICGCRPIASMEKGVKGGKLE